MQYRVIHYRTVYLFSESLQTLHVLMSKNHAMTVYKRTGGKAPRIINLGTMYATYTLLLGKEFHACTEWKSRAGEHRTNLDTVMTKETILSLSEIDFRTSLH